MFTKDGFAYSKKWAQSILLPLGLTTADIMEKFNSPKESSLLAKEKLTKVISYIRCKFIRKSINR